MKIAVVTSEAAPFAKTGGLADVAGALPKALFRLGHNPILVMPLYQTVRRSLTTLTPIGEITIPIGDQRVPGRIFQGQIPGTEAPAYFIENDEYFNRSGLYGDNSADYPDNCARFAFLSRGAIETVKAIGFAPEIFHIHDWQTALIAPYLRILYKNDPVVAHAATILTIHNISHQGVFWHWDMPLIGLDWKFFNWKEFEFWGKINLLKAGIVFADQVNTVSPTYAAEIQTPAHGHGLEDVLKERSAIVHGVVNGIDDTIWNPAYDTLLTANYGPEDMSNKEACKRALQRQCGLPQRKTPIAGIVSRFARQKGLDLVAHALPLVFEHNPLQCIILGDGFDGVRQMLEEVAVRYPDRLRVFARYDERLAHRIMAGSDMIIVPSRFEPCGLTQLYAFKYGSVPIVRRTGGLSDTVCDCTPETLAAGRASGFTFDEPSPKPLAQCIARALELHRDPTSWRRLVEIGMSQDWSWEASAKRYVQLYHEAKDLRLRP